MILTIGPGGCGFTFLNWSIAYLRGDVYYNTLDGKKSQVDICPFSGVTAHNFTKDHIQTTKDLEKINLATDQSIIFVVPSNQSDLDYALAIHSKKIIFDAANSSQELIARMCMTTQRYSKLIREFSTRHDPQILKQVIIDCSKFFTSYYKVPDNYDCFIIKYSDIFQTLDFKIYDIFKYLGLTITQERMEQWLPLYYEYRLLNQDVVERFLGNTVPADNNEKTKILKELIEWKHILSQNK